MQTFYYFVDEANKFFETADHLTYVTFPVLNDNKLFITIVENLYKSVMSSIRAVVHYDKLFKRIPVTGDDFSVQLEIFKTKCAQRYNIPREVVLLAQDLRKILDSHKISSMEFSRRDKYVMASRDFHLKTINLYKIKSYLSQTKTLVDKVNSIAAKNERIFRRQRA